MNIREVILDGYTLAQGYILRDGYVFASLTEPANIYDAIVIKNPYNAGNSYRRVLGSARTLFEQIEFVNKYRIEKAIVIAEEISFIVKCPTLKYIQIIPSDTAGDQFDYSPLYDMPEIKGLNCATEYGTRFQLSSLVDYSKIYGIEELHISGKGHLNYEKLALLKSLNISGFKGKKKDVSNLFCSDSLEKLEIIQCGIQSLNGLSTSKSISTLSLYYNRSLVDVSDIRKISGSLKELSIDSCSKIEEFTFLYDLHNLECLRLHGNNSLLDLGFLKKMKNLKIFTFSMDVRSGDLSPCLNIPYVYSEKNRKHYNLKDKDLPKNL